MTAGAAIAAPNMLVSMHNPNATSMNINMGAQNGSRETGTASLKQNGKNLWVKISLSNEPHGASQPAHIHMGTCATLNPAPWKVLKNVVNGTSVTTVPNLTIATLEKSKYAINVHESAANLKRYVSCGTL